MGSVHTSVEDGVAIIRLSTPGKLNAWDLRMRRALIENLRGLEADARCRAVVVTGEGDDAFCAGQDLDEAREWDAGFSETWVLEIRELFDTVRLSAKPVVAAVNGVAAGSGFQFALCCDARVTRPGARLGQPEVRSGLASVTGSWLIQRTVGASRMRELVLTARLLTAEQALEWGIVNRLVEPADLLPTARDIALEMAALPVESFSLTKRAIADLERRAGYDDAFHTAVRYQSLVYQTNAPQRVMTAFRSRHARRSMSER